MSMCKKFLEVGEYYAAGLFENERENMFCRKSLALRRYYENCPLPPYNGEKLYPSGRINAGMAVTPFICYSGFSVDEKKLSEKDPALCRMISELDKAQSVSFVPKEHTVAGDMFTHSMPNFERVMAEGLDGYEQRIRNMSNPELREGLLNIICGVRNFHGRALRYLEDIGADEELLSAFKKVPFSPCENITDAVVCWNFVLYLDGCDNVGSLAQGLMPYYNGENIEGLLDNLFRNLDICDGYSMAIGMEDNPLVVQCLNAVKGKRRPMTELFVDEETSDDVWNAALDCVMTGGGQPAFYNKKLYRSEFSKRFPEVAPNDLLRLCGGGCTEMMLPGLSNVGSLDAGINMLFVFEKVMQNNLLTSSCFDEFYEMYIDAVHDTVINVMESIAKSQKHRADICPLPMRTLLADDCIENELDYNNGGCRYAWSIISFAGIVNVIDSLLVIRDKVFVDKTITAAELLERLNNNDREFLVECKANRNRHGIDCTDANALAMDITSRIFEFTKERKPYIGLGFIPASILFRSYGDAGKIVGATPCGRGRGEPLADSLTAIFGKDTAGVTALLKSVTFMDLKSAIGTPVVNLTISPRMDKNILKGLIVAYMELGGMQLQITCMDKEILERAYERPDDYKNLIVRVGGFSEYFCRLDDTLKRKVIERTYY